MVDDAYNLSKQSDWAKFSLYLTQSFIKMRLLGQVKSRLTEFSYLLLVGYYELFKIVCYMRYSGGRFLFVPSTLG